MVPALPELILEVVLGVEERFELAVTEVGLVKERLDGEVVELSA